MKQKIYFLFFTFLSITLTNAQTFTDNGINYNVTDATNFKVEVGLNSNFSGDANIPAAVTYIGSEATYEAAAVWTNFNPINGVLANDSFVTTNFSMYPNPSNGIVNISLENNMQLEKVNFYNQLGQLVKTATNHVISTSELAKGSYFVEVITNNGKATKQLVTK